MVDAIFAEPRLAEVYDPLDPDRGDLDPSTFVFESDGAVLTSESTLRFATGTR